MKTKKTLLCVALSLVLAFCACGFTACDNNQNGETYTVAQKTENFAKSVTEIKEGEGFNFNIDNVAVSVPGLEISYVALVEGKEESRDVLCDLKATATGELFVGKDNEGAFTLKAHAKLTADMIKAATETDEEVSGTVSHGELEAALYIKGENVYLKYTMNTTYPGIPEAYRALNNETGTRSAVLTIEQIKEMIKSLIGDKIPGLPGGTELPEIDEGMQTAITAIAQEIEKLYDEKVASVLETKKAESDANIEKVVAALKKTLIDVTADGDIVIKTNSAKLKALNSELYTMTLDKLIDKYAGEGTFASLKADVNALLDYTVGDVFAKLAEYGITEDDIFGLLDNIAVEIGGEGSTIDKLLGMEAGELRKKLDEEKDTKILALIKEVVPTFDETTVRSAVAVAFTLMESNTTYDLIATVVNSSASEGDAKFDKKAVKEKVDTVIDTLGEMLKVTLTLDSKGNFKSLNVKTSVNKANIVALIGSDAEIPDLSVSVEITALKGAFINAAEYDYDAMANEIDNPSTDEEALLAA